MPTFYYATSAPDTFRGELLLYDDTVSYEQSPSGLFASLENSERNTGWAAGDSNVWIDNLYGSEFNDILAGDDFEFGHNTLYGLGGNDLLYGLWGDDYLYGGSGPAVLEGMGMAPFNSGGKINWSERSFLQNDWAHLAEVAGEPRDEAGWREAMLKANREQCPVDDEASA